MARMPRKDEAELAAVAEFVRERYEQGGLDGLTRNQQLFHCVNQLVGSTFLNYFVRDMDPDEDWGEKDEPPEDFLERTRQTTEEDDYAEAGLKAIGAPKAAKVFAAARKGGDWDSLEDRFRNAEDVEALLLAFARKHPKDFPPAAG